jgi:hypothetical protein
MGHLPVAHGQPLEELRMVRCSAFLPLALGLAGCVSTYSKAPVSVEDSRSYAAPFDAVWAGAVGAVSALALPIQAIEKESGILATGLANCGEGRMQEIGDPPSIFLAVWWQGRYSLSVFVRTAETGEVLVRVTTHIEAFESNLSGKWHKIQSRGVLEKEFLDAIAASLGGGSGLQQ